MFLVLPYDLTKPRDYMVIWLYGWKTIKESHHPVKFCGEKYCGRRDVTVQVSHVILKDSMTKEWSNIKNANPS